MAKKAAAKPHVVTPEVIDGQERPEVALIRRESEPVATLMQNMQVFFAKAEDLEAQAKAELADAQATWKAPTCKEEDEDLVARIRQNAAATKEFDAHWEITTVLSRMHRSMTGLRNRGADMREKIKNHGNYLHAAWERLERERVQREEAELRRQEQARLQQQREAEAAEAERTAIEAEANSPHLGERESRFVDLYMANGGDAVRAAKGAGYANVDANANRLLKTSKIMQAIEARRQAVAIRQQAAAKAALPVEPTIQHAAPVAQVAAKARTYQSCEVTDAAKFMAVLLDPQLRAHYRVPAEAATFVQSVLNDMARQIGDKVNLVPGLRLKVVTSV